eukprot:TRINITY_DN7650_c0_g1_i2.p1 TRINITY_DN7650_c0_g1~~TRINITY_DN7650_c0_g1_i2.p1  ORF type:complete len:675 (+),score=190.67 TRINITY_DN7650_c0_g1_i2:92-2116(+)
MGCCHSKDAPEAERPARRVAGLAGVARDEQTERQRLVQRCSAGVDSLVLSATHSIAAAATREPGGGATDDKLLQELLALGLSPDGIPPDADSRIRMLLDAAESRARGAARHQSFQAQKLVTEWMGRLHELGVAESSQRRQAESSRHGGLLDLSRLEGESRLLVMARPKVTPYVGFELAPSKNRDGHPALRVTRCSERGPAHRAGLREGDVVGRINGRQAAHLSDAAGVLCPLRVSDEVTLQVERDRGDMGYVKFMAEPLDCSGEPPDTWSQTDKARLAVPIWRAIAALYDQLTQSSTGETDALLDQLSKMRRSVAEHAGLVQSLHEQLCAQRAELEEGEARRQLEAYFADGLQDLLRDEADERHAGALPYLGVELAEGVTRATTRGPVGTLRVIKSAGPALRAGIKNDDVVERINGRQVPTLGDAKAVLCRARAGDFMTFQVWRQQPGQSAMAEHTVTVTAESATTWGKEDTWSQGQRARKRVPIFSSSQHGRLENSENFIDARVVRRLSIDCGSGFGSSPRAGYAAGTPKHAGESPTAAGRLRSMSPSSEVRGGYTFGRRRSSIEDPALSTTFTTVVTEKTGTPVRPPVPSVNGPRSSFDPAHSGSYASPPRVASGSALRSRSAEHRAGGSPTAPGRSPTAKGRSPSSSPGTRQPPQRRPSPGRAAPLGSVNR